MQLRGILDNVFQMCSTRKAIPKDVYTVAFEHVIKSLSDPNVCKLMCNKYDLTETKVFDSDYGDFGRNDVRANLWLMMEPKYPKDPELKRLAYKLVETICHCPRLYVRVVDQTDENLDKIAESVKAGLTKGSEEPVSFGAFCDAVFRLCQHTKIRAALMRQPGLLTAAREAVENLLDEMSAEGKAALGRMLLCLTMLVLDMSPNDEVIGECNRLGEIVSNILDSNRAAGTRRCARAAAKALEMLKLEDKPTELFDACKDMFLEHYNACFNKTDEFGPTPDVINDAKHLLEILNGGELFDAPALLYAGAFRCLGKAVASVRDTELYTKYKENGGFDMMVRHRAIPRIMKMPLAEMKHERYVMAAVWALGLDITPDNRDTLIRYIQMPNVIDHAVELIRKPTLFPIVVQLPAIQLMLLVCKSQDICRMVCNRIDFPPFMVMLFDSVPLPDSELVEELRYRLFKVLSGCSKLIYRLNEENNYDKVILGLEKLIADGWSRPLMFRRVLESARLLYSARLTKPDWHRQGMLEATSTAVGLMVTMIDGVPDEDASVNLVRFAEVLLRRSFNEELFGSLKMVSEAEYLPAGCREKAADCVKQIEAQRQSEAMDEDEK